MLTGQKRTRYNLLREQELDAPLSEDEAQELAALMQEICDAEASYLVPVNERMATEQAEIGAAVERLEARNNQLKEYLRERQAFLARARTLVTQLHTEERQLRDRFRDALMLEPSASQRS